jgi:hypothetical protein
MLLAFRVDVLERALSAEEHSQILRTIEMFEAISPSIARISGAPRRRCGRRRLEHGRQR